LKPLAIISEPKAVSFWEISQQIASVLKKQGAECKVYSWDTPNIKEPNILFLGNVFNLPINYLQRFLPEKNVVFYAITEGNPILDTVSLDAAQNITFITPSIFTKQCLEAVGLKVEAVIPHGIDLEQRSDEKFMQRIKTLIPQPSNVPPSNIMLCIAGNVQRKALDKLIIAYKTVEKTMKDCFLILHSGMGDINIMALQQALDLKRFLFTNSWGLLDKYKITALYRLCDFYVQPSEVEGFGLTYIEAFAQGKPVIGVDCPNTNQIVKHGYTGLLLPVKKTEDIIWQQRHAIRLHHFDVDNLIDAMLVMCDKNTRINMSVNAQKQKADWNMNEIYPRILKWMK
jgi:glycosyltransferase involved in cell wall biosynthesis